MSRSRQLSFALRTWGGARPGAGRKRAGPRRVPHRRRPRLCGRKPIHLVWRIHPGLCNLRGRKAFRRVLRSFRKGKDRFGFRVIHFSVMSNHLHLIVEAPDALSLTKGAKGLAVRIAKAVNKLLGRRGAVIADRYFQHVLHSPREVAAAVDYVLGNFWRHGGSLMRSGRVLVTWAGFTDPLNSAGIAGAGPPATVPARTWLLRRGEELVRDRYRPMQLDEFERVGAAIGAC